MSPAALRCLVWLEPMTQAAIVCERWKRRAAVAARCEICGKTTSFGHNVSHSKRRTNRDFRVNVQRKRLMINGEMRRLTICTRCMRTATKSA